MDNKSQLQPSRGDVGVVSHGEKEDGKDIDVDADTDIDVDADVDIDVGVGVVLHGEKEGIEDDDVADAIKEVDVSKETDVHDGGDGEVEMNETITNASLVGGRGQVGSLESDLELTDAHNPLSGSSSTISSARPRSSPSSPTRIPFSQEMSEDEPMVRHVSPTCQPTPPSSSSSSRTPPPSSSLSSPPLLSPPSLSHNMSPPMSPPASFTLQDTLGAGDSRKEQRAKNEEEDGKGKVEIEAEMEMETEVWTEKEKEKTSRHVQTEKKEMEREEVHGNISSHTKVHNMSSGPLVDMISGNEGKVQYIPHTIEEDEVDLYSYLLRSLGNVALDGDLRLEIFNKVR